VYQIYHQVERGSYIPELISATQVWLKLIARSRASRSSKKRHNMSSTIRASPKPFLLLSCSTLHRASCSSLLYFTSAETKMCRLPAASTCCCQATRSSRNKIAYLSRYVECLHFFAMIVFITVDSENILKHNDFLNSEKHS
jgi:hypothetical protein